MTPTLVGITACSIMFSRMVCRFWEGRGHDASSIATSRTAARMSTSLVSVCRMHEGRSATAHGLSSSPWVNFLPRAKLWTLLLASDACLQFLTFSSSLGHMEDKLASRLRPVVRGWHTSSPTQTLPFPLLGAWQSEGSMPGRALGLSQRVSRGHPTPNPQRRRPYQGHMEHSSGETTG